MREAVANRKETVINKEKSVKCNDYAKNDICICK
jgi:hypothetical protein